MMRLIGLLLLALALTFGLAQSDQYEDPPEAPATTEEGAAGGEDAATEEPETTEPATEEAETEDADAAAEGAGAEGDAAEGEEPGAEDDAAGAEGEEAGTAAEGEPVETVEGGGEGATEFDFDDPEAAFEQLMAEEREPVARPNEVAEFLAEREDMSIFLMLLDHAGMTETLLEGDRPITIFAPSDSAFAEIDRLRFSTMLDDPEALRQVLERHIAFDTLTTADIGERLSADGAVAGGGEAEIGAAADPGAAEGAEGEAEGEAAEAEADAEEEAADTEADAEEEAADAEADTVDVEVEPEAVADVDAEAVAEAAEEARLDPNAFARISTRGGEDIELGRLPASDRAAALGMDETEVAGGGAGEEAAAPADAAEEPGAEDAAAEETTQATPGVFYVNDAKIAEPNLSADETTIHVIDAVLLPPLPEEPVEE
jgi:uncharacterized surface protein with fasciclin (FAS1) repeats